MSHKTENLIAEKGPRANFATTWSYAPAPETAKVVIAPRYDLFINGKFVPPVKRKYFPTINPADEKPLSEVGEASTEDVNKAVKAARAAYDNVWSKMTGKERGKYIFRIARILQERAREFAIIESMDGGKPIRESRDVDIPLASAHFFYYAGWADKLDYAFPGRTARLAGRRGTNYSVEFSAPDGRMENRPGAGDGKYGCA